MNQTVHRRWEGKRTAPLPFPVPHWSTCSPQGTNPLGFPFGGCLEATSCRVGISSDLEVVQESEAQDVWGARLAEQQQPRRT